MFSKFAMACSLLALGLPGIIVLIMQAPLSLLLGPEQAKAELPMPEFQLRILIMLNPAILLGVAALIGAYLAPPGLSAPVLEALLRKQPIRAVLKHQILPALFVGACTSVQLAVFGWNQSTFPELAETGAAADNVSLLGRILYGGIVEEIMLRWGMMSFFVWLGWRYLQLSEGLASPAVVWPANVLTALLFGLGHLPAAFASGLSSLHWIVLIVANNFVAGVAFGWLFWRKGLEAVMMAHALAHVLYVLVFAPVLTSNAEL